jgi:uncharacterized protein
MLIYQRVNKIFMYKILTISFLSISLVTSAQTNCDSCKAIFNRKEFTKAKSECVLAAKSGDPFCQALLGIIYLSESDFPNARTWFEKSANSGDPNGQNGLGYLYQNGLGGLTKDLNTANIWFLKSAEQDNSDSQFWLGENLFLSGNLTEGYKWTLKAALNGSADGQFNLGAMIINGEGTEQNDSLAITWFIISTTNGNEKARRVIDDLKLKNTEQQFQKYIDKTKDFINQNPGVIK